ncbi:hypothetical protein NKG05_15715 [Oerskovia sp. M15]
MFPLDEHGGAAEYAVIAAEFLAAAPARFRSSMPLRFPHRAGRPSGRHRAGRRPGRAERAGHRGGGAVGSIVVQLASDAGATVTAVDGPQHTDRLLESGASTVVGPLDLDAGPAAVNGPFDVVINHVRLDPEGLAKLTAYVADGVSRSAPPEPCRPTTSARYAPRACG